MSQNKKNSFKHVIKKSFILYSLVPITIITLIFYNMLIISFSKWSYKDNRDMNEYISQLLEYELSEYKNDIIELSSNEDTINILLNKQSDSKNIFENIYDKINRKKIKSIFHIYNIKGESVLTNSVNESDENKSKSIYDWGKFRNMNSYPQDVIMRIDKIQINPNVRTIYTIGKAVTYHDRVIGFIEFDILENELSNIISCSADEDIVITDKYNNNIINTNNFLLNKTGKFKSKEYESENQVITNSILNENIYIYTIKNTAFINKFFITGEIFLGIIFGLLFLVMICVANKIAAKNTKSIDILLNGIEYVKQGDLTKKVNITSGDEFEILGEYYNEMIDKVVELIKKNEEEAKIATLAQLKHLESQFNPHFIFNTLEMLRYMIKSNDPKCEKVTLAMARILRYSLDNKTRSTCLNTDIKYIKYYLDIQKLRFGERFDYDIYINEDCEKAIIPKLIIQPIIENSIKYGYQNKENLFIDIYAEQKDGDMLIQISDNGDGMSNDLLHEINKIIKNKNNKSSHIGLYNVQKRISLLYGEKYGIEIDSREGIGTCILIKIPVFRGNNDD